MLSLVSPLASMLTNIDTHTSRSAASTPNVFYFRRSNYDTSRQIIGTGTGSGNAHAELQGWETTLNLFDSVADVTVQRLDVVGKLELPLLQLQGPAYFFSNASSLSITDSTSGKTTNLSYSDAIAWASADACLQLTITPSNGAASVYIVGSGTPVFETKQATCKAADIRVGATLEAGLRDNPVPYELTSPSLCEVQGSHRDTTYSNLDEPIGPLGTHFHTRGALYYVQYGSAKFNDEAAPNDTALSGELRFVNTGVFYGPEVLDRDKDFVASVHEVDPGAIDFSAGGGAQCPFACFLSDAPPVSNASRCVRKSKIAAE